MRRLENICVGLVCILFPILLAAALISEGKIVKIKTWMENKIAAPHDRE